MTSIETHLTHHIDLWTSAITRRSSAGRGRSKKFSLHGIEKLRALILDLAVRGKLVPQDPHDEPASELLKRIDKKKTLLNPSFIRKSRKYGKASIDWQYHLPHGWSWVSMSEIGHDWGQTTPSTNFTYIDVGSIDQRFGRISEAQELNAADAPSRARKRVEVGTIIYSTVRPYLLNIAIIDKAFDPEPIASTAFAIVHPYEGISASFVYRYLRSPTFISYVESCQTGIAYPAINDKQFFSAWFPLPPEAEQLRIVAKVDELMALCDQLEAKTYDAIDAHQLLVKELLATLTASRDAHELTENWARIETHFDALFVTQDSVDQLKQTILHLAVMGRLVPQDPKDEPASELLKRCNAKSAQLVSQGAINKSKQLAPIDSRAHPFSLPEGWVWARFEQTVDPEFSISYGVLVPGEDQEGGIPFVRIADLSIDNPAEFPEKSISPSVEAQYERTRLQGGEILMGVVGSIGKLGVAPASWRGANIARAICRIKPNSDFSDRYLLWILQSAFMQNGFKGDTRTLAQPTLNINLIRSALTPVPPRAEQERIVVMIEELWRLCGELNSALSQATSNQRELCDALVAKAVS